MFDITQHKTFKRLSAFLVLLNSTLLSVPWQVDDVMSQILVSLAVLFTLLFLVEVFMKLSALGFFGYWQSKTNRLDMFVTVLGLIWNIFHFISYQQKHLSEFSNNFGFVVIVLRFFTIAGKHVSLIYIIKDSL